MIIIEHRIRPRTRICQRVLAARRARVVPGRLPLRDERAQGRPGARCTRGLVCNVHKKVRTRAYRSSGEHPAFPAQWLYGLCRALPGDEFLLPPSPCELTAKPGPGRANFVFAKLDASHGRQDHTVLPYATTSPVLRGIDRSQLSPPCDLPRAQRHRVHRNPHSTYRDDAYAPLHEAGWRKEAIVSGKDEADYFRSAGWTTQITLEWLVKFDSARAVFFDAFYTAADRSTDRFARRAGVNCRVGKA